MATKPAGKDKKTATPAPVVKPSAPTIESPTDSQLRAELSRRADEVFGQFADHCSPQPQSIPHLLPLRHLLHALAMRRAASLKWSRLSTEKGHSQSWERLEEYLMTLVELTRCVHLAFVEHKLSARSARSGTTIAPPLSLPRLFLAGQFLEALPMLDSDARTERDRRRPDLARAVDALRNGWWAEDCHYRETVVDRDDFSTWAQLRGIVSSNEIAQLLASHHQAGPGIVRNGSRHRDQEERMLEALSELGLTAAAMPKTRGPETAKAKARRILSADRLFQSDRVFDKCWERLAKDGRIAYAA